MNSKLIRTGAMLTLGLIATTTNDVSALHISVHTKTSQQGIFGKMIEQATAPERLVEEKHEASERKKKQLKEAEKDYQSMVQQEEAEEALKNKKEAEEAENAALEAAQHSPQAKMLAAANDAASAINMGEMEASIQAQLQAKIDSGASRNEIMAQFGGGDTMAAAPMVESTTTQMSSQNTNAQSVIASVLAKAKASQAPAPVAALPVQALVQPALPRQVLTQKFVLPAPVAPVVQQVQSIVQVSAATAQSVDAKASEEKVKEMAAKLGVPFSGSLMSLGSNSAISDSLIEQAVKAGKSEQQINDAMNSL